MAEPSNVGYYPPSRGLTPALLIFKWGKSRVLNSCIYIVDRPTQWRRHGGGGQLPPPYDFEGKKGEEGKRKKGRRKKKKEKGREKKKKEKREERKKETNKKPSYGILRAR